MAKKVVAIVGPTASGKTSLSIEIAKRFNGEIVSCDSMQVYKHMNIGTAKPTEEEKEGISHYMIDEIEPDKALNVVDFTAKAKGYIEDILSRGKLPVLVGGTGLYIDSIVNNTEFSESKKDEKYRENLMQLAEEKGNSYVHEMLKEIDIDAYNSIHENNIRRVIRALEVYHTTGKTFTQTNIDSRRDRVYDVLFLGLDMDRETLYERINRRVDIMLEDGLIDEVKSIMEMNLGKASTAMQAIGYKEIIEWLEGRVSYEEAVETLKMESRRYAKRQLTWFRRNSEINWLDYKNAAALGKELTEKFLGE